MTTNKKTSGSIQKRRIKFSLAYSEIVDQTLQMNLLARELWQTSTNSKLVFTNLNSGYSKLCDSGKVAKIIKSLGVSAESGYFDDDGTVSSEKFSDFYDKIKSGKGFNSELIFTLPEVNPPKANKQTQDGHAKTARKILRDVCTILDKGKKLSTDSKHHQSYKSFLIESFSDLHSLNNTFHYGHENLYLCLFNFEKTYKNLFLTGFCQGVEQHKIGAIETKNWIDEILANYNHKKRTSNFIEISEDTTVSLPDIPQPLTLTYNSDLYQLFKSGKHQSLFDAQKDRIINMLHLIWDHEAQGKEWRNKKLYKPGLSSPKQDIFFEADYSEYRKFRQQLKELPLVLKRIDTVPTILHAILAFDYYRGGLKTNDKITMEKAIEKTNEVHWEQDKFSFQEVLEKKKSRELGDGYPTVGVRKKLQSIIRSIKLGEYSKNQSKLNTQNYSGLYLSFPLFRYIEE